MKFSSLVFHFFAQFGRGAFNIFGLFVIIIACGLISCVVYTYTRILLPSVYPDRGVTYFFLLFIMCCISFSVWFNYLMSLSVSPGVIPPGFQRHVNMRNSNNDRVCHLCSTVKPPRVHHCSLCGSCVMKMDHHCPWINNCVGFHNQRYFILFLVSLLVGTLYCGSLFAWVLVIHPERYPHDLSKSSACFLTFVICIALHIAMWGFVYWNLLLVLTNQTSIEYQINWSRSDPSSSAMMSLGVPYRNPYDVGRWKNFLEVFGTQDDTLYLAQLNRRRIWRLKDVVVVVLWMVLPTFQAKGGDGLHFETWMESSYV